MKNKLIVGAALALIIGSTAALAGNGNGPSGGDGSCTGNCPSTQGPGGSNENTNTNTNDSNSSSTSDAESTAVALSGSNSSSSSNASSGDVRSSVHVRTGGSSSSSTASTGDSTASATGGTALAVGGNSEAEGGEGGEASSHSGGNSLSTSYVDESSAASAASVFAGYCQTGGSGQTSAGGFSIVNPEQFCNHIRLAAVYQEAYQWELKNGSATCVAPMGNSGVGMGDAYSDTCMNEQAAEYLGLYRENLAEANDQLNSTEVVSKVDGFFGYLVRPIAVLALLILL